MTPLDNVSLLFSEKSMMSYVVGWMKLCKSEVI